MTDDEIIKTIGSNLRTIRERRGLSAEYIGSMLDLSPDAVRKYERGIRDPGIVRLIRAREILHCNYMTILSGLDDDPAGTEYNVLSQNASAIMRHLATGWSGDIEAMIIMMGMIAAFPEEQRRELYMKAALMKDELLSNGTLHPDDLPPGIEYMEQQLGALYE